MHDFLVEPEALVRFLLRRWVLLLLAGLCALLAGYVRLSARSGGFQARR